MGRGGHRYPIEHAEGRELDFASLLWDALFSHKSPQGAQFRSELDDIYLRWRRLVKVLTSYRTSSWNGPSSDLQHLVDSLKSLTIPTQVVYPRPDVSYYLDEVKKFCLKFNLDAWWAAPSIIDSHFKRGTIGSKRPLSIYMRGSFRGISRNVVVVKLPGRTEADFRRDSARLQEVVAKKVIESSYGSFEVHERLSRSDMALLEESIDASCAVIDWWDDSAISPREIQAECEKRIGRTYTKNESRELSKQITAQVDSVRDFQLNNSWTTAPTRNLANRYMEHANWVAALILNPSSTYDALWPTTHDDSFRSHRRACRKFAEAAQLKLANRNTARSRRNGRSTTESFIN